MRSLAAVHLAVRCTFPVLLCVLTSLGAGGEMRGPREKVRALDFDHPAAAGLGSVRLGEAGIGTPASPSRADRRRVDPPPVLFSVTGTITYSEVFGAPPEVPLLADSQAIDPEDADHRRESIPVSGFGPSVSWNETISNGVGYITSSGNASNGTLTLSVDASIDFTPPLCMICSSWFEFSGTVTAWVRDCNTPMSSDYSAGGTVYVDHPEGCGAVGPHGLAVWNGTSVGSGSDCSEGTEPIDEEAQASGVCQNAQYLPEYGAYYCPADGRSFHVEAFYSDGLHIFGGPKRIVARANGTAVYSVSPELGSPPTASMEIQDECPLCSRGVILSSTSEDPDGGDVSVTWRFPDGVPPSAIGPEAVVIWHTPGEHTVEMTVTDDECHTATNSFPVTVQRPKACVFDLVQKWCGLVPGDYLLADWLVGDIKDDLEDVGWDAVEVDVETLSDICDCLGDPCVRGASFVGHAVDSATKPCNTMVIKTRCPPAPGTGVTASDLTNCPGVGSLEYIESINCNVDPNVLGDALGVPSGARFGPCSKRIRGLNANCVGLVHPASELACRWLHDYPYPPGCAHDADAMAEQEAQSRGSRPSMVSEYTGYWVCDGELMDCGRDYMPVYGGVVGSFPLSPGVVAVEVDSAMFAVRIHAAGHPDDSVFVSVGMVGDPHPISGGMLPRRLHLDWEMPAAVEADSVIVELAYSDQELAASGLDEERLEAFFSPGDSVEVLRSIPVLLDPAGNTATCRVDRPGTIGLGQPGAFFVRGDSDASGELNISDPIYDLAYQFAGGDPPLCLDAADVDDSGEINISDPIYNLAYQFAGGPPPPAPESGCGQDLTAEDALGCGGFPPCGTGRKRSGRREAAETAAPLSSPGRVLAGPWVILSRGLAACPILLENEVPVIGLETTLEAEGRVLRFERFEPQAEGLDFDFLAAHGAAESGSVRLGAIPDFSLQRALEPGRHRLGAVVFSFSGAAPASSELPAPGTGILVDASRIAHVLEADAGTGPAPRSASAANPDPATSDVPARLALRAPSPNPTGTGAGLVFALPRAAEILLTVHDVAGRRVAVLADGLRTPGWHQVTWDGRDTEGRRAPPGVYFVRMSGAGQKHLQRLIVAR